MGQLQLWLRWTLPWLLWAVLLGLQLFGFLCLCITVGVALGGFAFLSLALEICKELFHGPNYISADDSGWSEDEVEVPPRPDQSVVEELPMPPMPMYLGDVLMPQLYTVLVWYFSRGQVMMLEH